MRNKLIKKAHNIIYSGMILLSLLCLNRAVFADGSSDFTAYAKQQAAREKEVIAPYQSDVNAIKTQVLQHQNDPKIKAFVAQAEQSKGALALGKMDHNHVTAPILVFVSFSMPKESMKLWMEQAQKVGGVVVLRGLINNSFKETAAKMTDLIKEDPAVKGLEIDPTLYKKFSITKVPALVVTLQNNCLPTESCLPDYDVVYGNTTMAYGLKKIADANTLRSPIAAEALKKLRGNDV